MERIKTNIDEKTLEAYIFKVETTISFDAELQDSTDENEKNYLIFFNSKKKEVLTGNFEQLIVLKQSFDKKYSFKPLPCIETKKNNCNCESCMLNKKKQSFSQMIQDKLNYKNSEIFPYLKNNNFKTCYVCNAQFAIAVEEEEIKDSDIISHRNKAKFQYDHILPRSLNPCFSISLYNLLPICSNCNGIKGNREIPLNLFSKGDGPFFSFKVESNGLISYLKNGKTEDLKIIIETDSSKAQIFEDVKKFSDTYDIKGIYNTQLDLIEELIQRKIKYNTSYKEKLEKSFPSLFIDTSIDERLILGTFTKEHGIHKRPMSKFLQDINDQLDEIV